VTRAGATAGQAGGAGLLDRAISYAVGTVDEVAPELLSRPTPCRGWDLQMLLRHASESLTALHEGIDAGRIGLAPAAAEGEPAADPAQIFRDRAGRLRGAWTGAGRRQRSVVYIAGCPLAASAMEGVGALEIAVHGWDISQACGHRRPIPRALAVDLLAIAPLLVPETGRHPLFAAPVTVTPGAGPSDQLAAFLGRTLPA
jgi:uncharacterized protein (TIGR03086 family)